MVAVLPTLPDEDWAYGAICPTTDPEAFFPEKGDSCAAAKAVCAGCPVRRDCRAWAIAHDFHGIWGGTTRHERLVIQGRRKPRKRATVTTQEVAA